MNPGVVRYMRLLIFGLGDHYRKYKRWIRDELIVGLLDNDKGKQGSEIDGHIVYSPDEIDILSYDLIVILSVHEPQMRKQLINLRVDQENIIGSSELSMHREILRPKEAAVIYEPGQPEREMTEYAPDDNTILLMSPNLDVNGATAVLVNAAQCLMELGYRVLFASWCDGLMRQPLEDLGIPVVVDLNLEIETAYNIPWLRGFQLIVCNTVHYYTFLSHKDPDSRFIWWLHEPPFFYGSINTGRLHKVDYGNIRVCSAGPLAAEAFKNFIPEAEVLPLAYGLPDIEMRQLKNADSSRLEMLIPANVQTYKGQDILVDAVARLTEQERDRIHIEIIGNNDSAFAKEQIVRARQYGDCIEFIPFMERETVEDHLIKAYVLICPSREDVMPVSVCEAMQRSIPCIVSDTIGSAGFITDEYDGLIFRSEDADGLADKIRWCINNTDLLSEMGKRSRKIYEENFSMEAFKKNIANIVNDIMRL